jgi:hypothetical protein
VDSGALGTASASVEKCELWRQGTLNEGEMLRTVYLLIKTTWFVKQNKIHSAVRLLNSGLRTQS